MSLDSSSLITTLLLILSAALGGGVIARQFKQPMILGYIAGGLLVGNILSGFVNREITALIADTGITLLLFTLGVEFSFHRLGKVLGSIAWAAVAQIVVSILVFLFLFLFFGLGFLPSLFLSSAASLSSTAIVVKLFSERGELETVPGETATGWLVVQDLAVVPLMILLAALSGASLAEATFAKVLGGVTGGVVKAGIILAIVVYLGRHGVPKLLAAVASLRHREIFLLATIGLIFLAGLTTWAVGLSAALGAFIAGLLVAETSQNHAVFAEIRPLRDLFAVVFFVSLGMSLPLASLVSQWQLIAVATVGVIVFKWLIIYGLLRFLGYHKKTSFLVALALTQISEFGFIIAQEGLRLGAIDTNHSSLLVAVIFLSIFLSSPAIARSHQVYYWVRRKLARLPAIFPEKEEVSLTDTGLPISDHIVICGYGRVGKYIGRALQMAGVPFLVVDYNQNTIKDLREKGIEVVYGDPADREVLNFAQVDKAKAVVIAIPDRHTQEMVIGNAQSLSRRIKIISRTHHEEDQKHLKALGVQMVVQPEFEAALSIVTRLLAELGVSEEDIGGKISRLKIEHGGG